MNTVHAQLERDGSGVLNLGQGESIKIVGGTLQEARMRVRALVSDHARTSRADIRFTSADPEGTYDMVVLHDGSFVAADDYYPQPATVDEDDTTMNLDVDPQGHVTDETTRFDSNASQPHPDDLALAASASARVRRSTTWDRASFPRRTVTAVSAWFGSLGRGARLGLMALVGVIAVTLIVSGIVNRSPSPVAGPPNGADGCIGGTNLARAVDQAADLATESTITQNGVTVPSPNGAAAAAAAFARLRSTLPPPSNRDELINGILASDATPLARQAIPAEPGWETQLDMTQGRWQVTSGNGQTAGLDLLLTTQATKDGQPVAPTQFTVAMNLVVEDGQWRLRDIGTAQTSPEVLAGANPYINGEGCSR